MSEPVLPSLLIELSELLQRLPKAVERLGQLGELVVGDVKRSVAPDAGAGEFTVSLKPSQRLLDLVFALRAFERDVDLIADVGHDVAPVVVSDSGDDEVITGAAL